MINMRLFWNFLVLSGLLAWSAFLVAWSVGAARWLWTILAPGQPDGVISGGVSREAPLPSRSEGAKFAAACAGQTVAGKVVETHNALTLARASWRRFWRGGNRRGHRLGWLLAVNKVLEERT